MRCEICDRYIVNGRRVKVEGSIIVACDECARYGESVGDAIPKKKEVPPPVKKEEQKDTSFDIDLGEGLIEGYPELIRRSREERGMKQEDLAGLINEPSSLIHRIESRRLQPSLKVVKKIQKALGVKLFSQEQDEGRIVMSDKKELTLGDLVMIKKKKR